MEIAILVIGVVAGVAADRLWDRAARYWSESRPAGKLWGWTTHANQPLRIVMSTCPTADESEYTDTIYPQEARAAAEVESYLKGTLRAKVRLLLSARVGEAINDNMVVIGGPVHNHVTRELLARLAVPFHFDAFALVHAPSGQRWEARLEQKANRTWITEDIALVLKAANPFRSERSILLIAGSRTHGCLAGARIMLREQVRTTLKEIEGLGPDYALVVRVQVHDDVLGAPKVIASYSLQDGALLARSASKALR